MLSSDTLKPLDWYNKEIKRVYKELHQAIEREKRAVREYNSLMLSVNEYGYKLSKHKTKEAKERYLTAYKVLVKEFERVTQATIERLGYSDYLHELKEKRSEAYDNESKFREQSN